MTMEIKAASERLSHLGEGPHWDVQSQKLYYVDLFKGDVCRLDPQTGHSEVVHLDKLTSFAIPYKKDHNQLLIAQIRDVLRLNFETGETEMLGTVEPNAISRINDGKCDAKGRLWTGTMIKEEKGKGRLYRMDSSYKFIPYADKIDLSNGLAWSLNNDTLYYIDSYAKKIFAFDYDLEKGSASNQRILFDYEDKAFENCGIPDGMTIDVEGKLWVACYGGGCVLRLDPVSKSILRKVDIPAVQVTSCCFGGPDFDVLYVTTASRDITPEEKELTPNAGAVFAVTGLGTRGQPLNDYVN